MENVFFLRAVKAKCTGSKRDIKVLDNTIRWTSLLNRCNQKISTSKATFSPEMFGSISNADTMHMLRIYHLVQAWKVKTDLVISKWSWITKHDWWFRLILVLQVFKVNLIGIKSFLGLVYLRTYVFGVFMFDRETIWHHETTNDFFEAAASLNRFVFISMIHNICWKEHLSRTLDIW